MKHFYPDEIVSGLTPPRYSAQELGEIWNMCFGESDIHYMKWLSKSPDLNLTEHLLVMFDVLDSALILPSKQKRKFSILPSKLSNKRISFGRMLFIPPAHFETCIISSKVH